MKINFKRITALLLSLLMICSIVACAKNDAAPIDDETGPEISETTTATLSDSQDDATPTPTPTPDGGNENGGTTPPAEVRMIELVKNSQAQYTIVSDAPIYDTLVLSFATRMTQATGISFFAKESAAKSSVSGKKIQLGKSPTALVDDDSSLSYNATISVEVGKTIHVTASHKDAVALAIDQFIEAVAAHQQEKDENGNITFRVPEQELLFVHEPEHYPYRNATLLGATFSEYVIVLPEQFTIYDRFIADRLIASIGEDTGYRLRYVKESKSTDAEYRIVIGRTNEAYSKSAYEAVAADGYLIQNQGKCLYIAYDNYLVASEVVPKLVSLYRADAVSVNEAQSFDYSAYLFERPEGTDLRLMSSNITVIADAKSYEIANSINYIDRMEILSQMYLKYLPDFIGLQEVEYGSSVNMFTQLMQRLDHKYAMLSEYELDTWMFGSPNKEAILYLKDVWKLEASGQGRYNPMHFWYWGVFSRLDDPDVKIIVMNVHYAGTQVRVDGVSNGEVINSIYKELSAQYGGIPIFVMGDLNAKYHQSTFGHTIAGTTLDSASRLVTDWGSHYTAASLNHAMYKNPIDHILLPTDRAEAIAYRFINEALMNISSGHRPIMADIQWKQ